MPELWMPGAERADTGRRLTMQGQNNARIFTWHTFEAPYSYSPDLRAATRFLAVAKSDPHFVFHPVTGKIVQMLPANTGGRTLKAPNHPRVQTNTYGRVHMQVEVIAYARRPWTLDLTPAGLDGLRRLIEFLRSWGIPDRWAGGVSPSRYSGEKRRFMPNGESGHTGHSLWVDNDHWDPGGIVAPWTLIGSGPKPSPKPVDPGRSGDVFFQGARGKDVRSWQEQLTAVGLGDHLAPAGVDGVFGNGTDKATRAFQRAVGITVDGRVGPETHRKMGETMDKLDRVIQLVEGLLETRPDGSKGARHERFQYHDVMSLLLYAADGGLAVRAELAKLTGELAGLSELVGQLANRAPGDGGPLDLEAVRQAAQRGTAEALARAGGALAGTVPADDGEEG